MYSSTIKDVILPNISINGFADDHALLKNWLLKIPQDQTDAINQLEFTLSDIEKWMQMNRLKMNNSKTEFVVFYPSRLGQYVSCDAINVNGEAIKASSAVKYLGVWLYQHLTMRKHISEKCRISMFNILRLKSIRPFLTMEATKTIASGIILSHLDYANSLFSGLPKLDTGKLQKVQSVCAKVVAGKTKYDSVTDTLKSLHWLPVH